MHNGNSRMRKVNKTKRAVSIVPDTDPCRENWHLLSDRKKKLIINISEGNVDRVEHLVIKDDIKYPMYEGKGAMIRPMREQQGQQRQRRPASNRAEERRWRGWWRGRGDASYGLEATTLLKASSNSKTVERQEVGGRR